jgi:hypothetical protein
MASHDSSALFELYAALAPGDVFRLLQRELGIVRRDGIYSARLLLWMMMSQRLQRGGTLALSVEQLAQGRFDALLSQCKRARQKNIALSTGGYCQARQHLPKIMVSRTMDELMERLRGRLLEDETLPGQRIYLLDGSSFQLEHSPELVEAYPPASNQHGKSHWPVVRVVVLHDLETALAERPQWGPLNGSHAVSEQALAEQAMQRIPQGSMIVGDRNFGIFATVWAAQQRGLEVTVRMTAVRAKSLCGEGISTEGDYAVCWRASRWDGKKQRNWPADASVPGRLIAWRVGRGKHRQWLYLFTTSALPAAEVVALYGRRWRIETDLRSLKQTVRLQRIAVQSTDMMEKELLVAVMAYNLVRAIMFQAARRSRIDPRQLSFTWSCNIVLDGYPKALAATTFSQQQQELDRIIDLVARCRLPRRSKHRTYPRQVWGRGFRYPVRSRKEN